MFSIRDRWIPAYFRDIHLAGLMRTTSRSESENSFFGSYLHGGLCLFNFTSSFEAAMEKQRNTQYVNDHNSEMKMPVLRTRLAIEKHVAGIYTHSIFKIVQQQIDDSLYLCSQHSVDKVGELELCLVKYQRKVSFKKVYEGADKEDEDEDEDVDDIVETRFIECNYRVKINEKEETITCSCNFYLHQGVFCRHIFCILKNKKIEEIPEKYILRRWKKGIISSEQLKQRYHYGKKSVVSNEITEYVYTMFESCMEMASEDSKAMDEFVKQIEELKAKMESHLPRKEPKNKVERIQEHLAVLILDVVEIYNPKNIRTKGFGSQKRIIGAKEKAIGKKNKGKECTYCHKVLHDYRNYPTRIEDERLEKEKKMFEKEENEAGKRTQDA